MEERCEFCVPLEKRVSKMESQLEQVQDLRLDMRSNKESLKYIKDSIESLPEVYKRLNEIENNLSMLAGSRKAYIFVFGLAVTMITGLSGTILHLITG